MFIATPPSLRRAIAMATGLQCMAPKSKHDSDYTHRKKRKGIMMRGQRDDQDLITSPAQRKSGEHPAGTTEKNNQFHYTDSVTPFH